MKRTPYVDVIFVFPGPRDAIRFTKRFPYPDEVTPSALADEIAEWIRGLDER